MVISWRLIRPVCVSRGQNQHNEVVFVFPSRWLWWPGFNSTIKSKPGAVPTAAGPELSQSVVESITPLARQLEWVRLVKYITYEEC